MRKSRGIDQKLDELFRAPFTEFIRTRNRIVAELRKQGDSARAAEIKRVKKPSVSAWVINQLFFNERELWAKLQEAGIALRRAYSNLGRGGSADDVRRAHQVLGRALDLSQGKARVLLKSSRRVASAAMLRRIGMTLRALLVREPEGAIQAGRLTADLDPPGFEALASAVAEPSPNRRSAPSSSSPARPQRPAKTTPRAATIGRPAPARLQEQKKAHAVQKERERRAKERKSAQEALRKALRHFALRSRAWEAASRKVEAARRALASAEAVYEKATRAQQSAQQAVAQARSALDQHD